MSARVTIALDGMGGDHAPVSVLEGAAAALSRNPGIRFLLFGNREALTPVLDRLPTLKAASELIHTETVVAPDAKPSQALRQAKDSSMRRAIDAVQQGQAQAVVSAGNTGALMAMSKIVLRTLPGIERPALATFMPTLTGKCVMLDMGANLECDARNLFQFGMMGAAFARALYGIERPKVGLLNVGSEEVKGHEELRAAAELLKNTPLPLEFYGFVEGNDIAEGTVDVVVTDGFTGNIALKSMEGTAKMIFAIMRRTLMASLTARIGTLLAKASFLKLKKYFDPRTYNGAVFLGLDGIAVKSHGNADSIGFANAIHVAIELAAFGLNGKITEGIRASEPKPEADTVTVNV